VELGGLIAAVVGFKGYCCGEDGEVGLVGWSLHGLIVVVDVHPHVSFKAPAYMLLL
jgi:cephalosporin-C deacetylase-like acetyl esterase